MTSSQKGKKKDRALTPKLRKLALLMPEVEDGKMTMKDAMLRAGYSEKTALQQYSTLGSLRNNTRMQEALAKAGFTEDVIAENIVDGIAAEKTFVVHEAEETRLETAPDYDARHKFLRTGAELLDAFPSKKIDMTTHQPVGYDEIEENHGKEANSPEEARKLADENS